MYLFILHHIFEFDTVSFVDFTFNYYHLSSQYK